MEQQDPTARESRPPSNDSGGTMATVEERSGSAPSSSIGRRARKVPVHGRKYPVLAVVMVMLVPLLIGACCDAALGSGKGWGLLLGSVVAATASAVLGARRGALSWVAPLPALAIAGVTAAVQLVAGTSSSHSKPASAEFIRWAVAAFPAMAAAECAALAVAAAYSLHLRSQRRSYA